MRVILQTWCQIQRTSFSLPYVICAPRHIQCIYSTAYWDITIHLKVGPLLLEVSRQFNEHYTARLVPITAHILQVTLCELWSRTYTMHLQHRIFRLHYSAVGICAAIVDITTLQFALYCKFGAKHSAHPPVYATWSVVPCIFNVITAPHIQASIFNWTYLCCYCRYPDIWMRVELQICCQKQRTSSRLRCVDCGPVHIQCNYSSAYSGFNI
jgi:hypothetical protein